MRKRLSLRAEELPPRECPALFGNPWLDPNLTLSFVPDGTPVNGAASQFDSALANIPAATRSREILRAFQSWIAIANVNVGTVPDGGQPTGAAGTAFHDPRFGDIRIAAVPLSADDVALALPFDATAGTRAGDLTFNTIKPFRAGTDGGYDLYSIALHEAGHIFGLAGSDDPNSAMYQIADRVRNGPSAADILAIQQLYGPRQADSLEGSKGNATPATAARVQPTGGGGSNTIAFAADITTADDVDVYQFKADKLNGGAFLVNLRTSGYSLLVPRIEILDGKGAVVADAAGVAAGSGDIALRLTNLKDGDNYYIRVTSADPVFAVGGYRVELKPEDGRPDDELDDPEIGDDDTAQTSTSLERLPAQAGTRQNFFATSSLSTPADVDFYRVRSNVPSGTSSGTLTASVVATGAGAIDPVIQVFDALLNLQSTTVLVHDGGEFTVQLPDTAGNQDYFVAVRHAHPTGAAAGNYTLGIDFGGPIVPLQAIASGNLTGPSPASTTSLTVTSGQVFHLILQVDPTATPAAARLSLFDSSHVAIDSRLANAGEVASLNVFLKPGVYQLLVGGGSTDGGAMPTIAYSVRGLTLSDPIGPRAVDAGTDPPPVVPPGTVPPPPPPIAVSPPHPVTPTVPVNPTTPNILLIPPTDQPTSPTLQLRPVAPAPARTFSIGVGGATGSAVQAFNADGTARFSMVPFSNYSGPLRTSEADFTGDGVADILVGTGPGSASHVLLVDGKSQATLFAFDPFEATFTGGTFVVSGDVTGDGVADLVVTPDEGGGPRVRVFNGVGFGAVMDFFGIDDANFRGGARAAIGDVNADGTGDLIVAAGFAGGPRVAGFDGAALAKGTVAHIFGDFFAFEETLRNGVYISAGDIDGDGFAEVIAGGGPGGGPRVLALNGKDLLANNRTVAANFFGGDPAARDGIRLAAKNLDNDGRADLVVGVGRTVLGYAGIDIQPSGTPVAILNYDVAFDLPDGVFVG